jgi:hypothetical protein
MARTSRLLLTVVVSTLLWGVVAHAGEAPKPDATFTTQVEQVVPPGGGFGFTWGKGTLTMADGRKHQFSLENLGVTGNIGGIADLEAHGDVYNLKKAEDFAGNYRRAPADAPAGVAPKAIVMKNQHGVVVAFKVKTETTTDPHLELTPSDTGVTVTMVPSADR